MSRTLLGLLGALALFGCGEKASCPDAGPDLGSRLDSASVEVGNGGPTQRCGSCHLAQSAEIKTGLHSHFPAGCVECHQNGLAHQAAPAKVEAAIDFSVEGCGRCHVVFAPDFLKSDETRAGKYGGSIKISRLGELAGYQHLMGGHDSTIAYDEDRGHAWILKDHRESKRPKNAVCLQCKSTPVAYFWNERRRGRATFSKEVAWADAVKRIGESWPKTVDHGVGCNHCHSPHSTGIRLIRKKLIEAILERGTDPYSPQNFVPRTAAELTAKLNEKGGPHKLTPEARRLAGILTCAQCHVEHTAGAGVDAEQGVLRDDLPWRKLRDLEAYDQVSHGLRQDWLHSVTGLPGIKPQHPEVESYWESTHHKAGASCADCHMEHAAGYADHWMTSPLKQIDGACAKCHPDPAGLKAKVIAIQDGVMAKAKQVELGLEAVLARVEALASDPSFERAKLNQAKDHFMRALLWWDWTAVAENSVGFHHPAEAEAQLKTAAGEVGLAKALLGL